MVFASLMSLLDNEFKYIFFENAIAYADNHVVQADCNADPELVGQLVYMSCPVTGLPSLKDSLGGSGLTSLLIGETLQLLMHPRTRRFGNPNKRCAGAFKRLWLQGAIKGSGHLRKGRGGVQQPTVNARYGREAACLG